MAYAPGSWRSLFAGLRKQSDPRKQLALCHQSRQLMQERLIELGSQDQTDRAQADNERADIEKALRCVWEIEQRIRKLQP